MTAPPALQRAVDKLTDLERRGDDERYGIREHLDWHGHLPWSYPWVEYFVGQQLHRAHLETA